MGSVAYAADIRSTTSSMRELWTIARRSDVQRWPAVPAAANVIPRTTSSMSADGATMAALLPPSSRMLRPKRAATTPATCWPIRVEPVALISGTPGCATSAAPTSAPPSTTWLRCGRRTDRRGGLVEQRAGRDRGERREIARLPDHRVAGDDGERRVPTPHCDREVERGDHAGRARAGATAPSAGGPVARWRS